MANDLLGAPPVAAVNIFQISDWAETCRIPAYTSKLAKNKLAMELIEDVFGGSKNNPLYVCTSEASFDVVQAQQRILCKNGGQPEG
jgi:hypothetical protein